MAGDHYYRIKATMTNGSLTFSEVIKVDGLKEEPAITIYPNPVSGKKLQLHFRTQPAGRYEVQVLNQLGQVLQNSSVMLTSNQKRITIPLGSSINPGQYQINMVGPNGTTTQLNILVE
jgi:hypothetical protein